jgi:biotin carboxyl carrier protein
MIQIAVNGNETFDIDQQGNQLFLNGALSDSSVVYQPNGLISILHRNKSYTALVEKVDIAAKELTLRIDGQRYVLQVKEDIDLLLSKMGMNMAASQKAAPVKAPMPGMVLKVLVEPGQQVNKGDGLLILEAMKMENVLKASASATVKSVKITERTAVEKGAVLIEME